MNPIEKRPSRSLTTSLILVLALALPVVASAAVAESADGPETERRRVVVVPKVNVGDGGERIYVRLLGGGYLGIETTELTPELRSHFGTAADRGVMIARLEPDGPAAAAGLAVGDVITAVDGKPVAGSWDLGSEIRGRQAGATVSLEVVRDRRSLDFHVTVRERDREQIDVGRFFLDGPGAFGPGGMRERMPLLREGGGPDRLYLHPEAMERLGDSLGKLDWPRLESELGTRNRELVKRLEVLEKRLAEMEKELARSRRP